MTTTRKEVSEQVLSLLKRVVFPHSSYSMKRLEVKGGGVKKERQRER